MGSQYTSEFEDGISKSMLVLLTKFIASKAMNKIAPNIFQTFERCVSRGASEAQLAIKKGAAKMRESFASAKDSVAAIYGSAVDLFFGKGKSKSKGLPTAHLKCIKEFKELSPGEHFRKKNRREPGRSNKDKALARAEAK